MCSATRVENNHIIKSETLLLKKTIDHFGKCSQTDQLKKYPLFINVLYFDGHKLLRMSHCFLGINILK